MVVADNDLLVDFDRTVIHLAHTDAAYIFVVVDGADQHLCARVGVSLRNILRILIPKTNYLEIQIRIQTS